MRIVEKMKDVLRNRKRLVWGVVLAVVVLLLAVGGAEAYRTLYAPQSLFKLSTMNPAILKATTAPTPAPEGSGEDADSVAAAPTVSTGPEATAAPDITAMDGILNVLLIGIDRSQTVGKLSGNDPHADVMMVVAINLKKKKADLISLPRDTFIHAPEIMSGVYKLNASFNVGGGFSSADGGGFRKVCEAAQYMLGGIPVDYYYGVDFTSLVSIVNLIGGVDYEVENKAYSRKGIAGVQHMDGEDVLFYLRTRKVGPERGDVNRVNRQKKMLIAIFDQLTKNGKLSMLPGLLGAASGGIYTNTTLQQTLALANFAKQIGADKIGMHSMAGDMVNITTWNYCFTDQKERQKLIKQVYGIDVPQQVHCTPRYLNWLVDYGFLAIRYQKTASQVLRYADARRDGFTVNQQAAYDALTKCCMQTEAAYNAASLTFARRDNRALTGGLKELKALTEQLAQQVSDAETLTWTYDPCYWNDPAINEVLVDFR